MCPKEHNRLNRMPFPVVAQTYFKVGQECLRGLEGQPVQQKSSGGRDDKIFTCEKFGENPAKVMPVSGWT
jgi:hypothetical protein